MFLKFSLVMLVNEMRPLYLEQNTSTDIMW